MLTNRRQVWAAAGFIGAAWAKHGDGKIRGARGELALGVAPVADEQLAAAPLAALKQVERDLTLVARPASSRARGVPSGAQRACKRTPQNQRE